MRPSVAILAGGKATRLGPIAQQVPKALIDVAGQPFAVWQLELLAREGLSDVVFVVGHLGEMISDALGNGSRWGVRVQYVFDGPRPLGTGGGIRQALPVLSDPFFVLYGDSYLECDYAAVERAFAESGRRGLMTVYRNDNQLDRSNVRYADHRIVAYDKRHPTPDMHHIDYGLGVFRAAAFADREAGVAFDLAGVYQDLLAQGDLAGFEVTDRFYEIGSPRGLEETRTHLATKRMRS
jgi:NDP-sugar pyrophosphorylase family protein